MKRFWIAMGAVSAVLVEGVAAGAVYVDVETTEGTFTVEMDESARNGGAAFLGLAEGWVDWVDALNGEPKHGERYFEGTWVNWVLQDGEGRPVMLGDFGRMFHGADGEDKWNNGSGAEMPDDVSGNPPMPARSVAMLQKGGIEPWEWVASPAWPTMPHGLDGRWGVALQDAEEYCMARWSRVGTVVSNWDVVEALAARSAEASKAGSASKGSARRRGRMRNAKGLEMSWRVLSAPVEVTGTRVHGDAAAIAAWRAVAASNAPTCGTGQTGLAMDGGSGTLLCGMEGKGRYAIAHTTNLTDRIWNLNWMNWNESDGALVETNGFSTAEGAFGPRRFFASPVVEFPALGGPEAGKMERFTFKVEWELGGTNGNPVFLYNLDMVNSTGMVWQLDAETQSVALRSAAVYDVEEVRSGGHSTRVGFLNTEWWQAPYYWLAEEKAGDGRGRFRLWDAATGDETWGTWMMQGK